MVRGRVVEVRSGSDSRRRDPCSRSAAVRSQGFLSAVVVDTCMPNCGCATPDEAFHGLDEDDDEEEISDDVRRCAKET